MTEGVGLSIGATAMGAVAPHRATATRRPVLTLYRHRPPELGVPSENPNIDPRGLVITDFVDRVGDPVGILAADGSVHRADALAADALCALMYTITDGLPPAQPAAVAFPAHWSAQAVGALRRALAALPEWSAAADSVPVISDAAAALAALAHEPGLPTRGVVALCDFGGTGSSITLADAGNDLRQIGLTVRHAHLCGDLIDHALLTHVLVHLPADVDFSDTAALGSLTRLRAECRAAKERLSATTVTALIADVGGFSGTIRLTRAELEEHTRRPLAEFMAVAHEALARNGIRPSDLSAVASVGGGANIPFVTTTLSEHLRVPVITTPRPELTAAAGAARRAAQSVAEDRATAVVAAVPAPEGAPAPSPALAWSQEEPLQRLEPSRARPQLQFLPNDWVPSGVDARQAWYHRPLLAVAGGAAAIALMAGAIVLHQDSAPLAATTTPTSAAPTAAAPSAAAPAAGPGQPGQPQAVVHAPVPVAQSRPIEQQADQQPPAPAPAASAPMPVIVAAPPIPEAAPAQTAPDPPPPPADTPTPVPPTTPPAVVTTTTPSPTTTPPPSTITQPPTTTQPPPPRQPPPTTTQASPPESEPPSTTQSAPAGPHGHH